MRPAESPAAPTELVFWQSFWITMRPYLAFVSGGAALAGMAFVAEPSRIRIALALPPLFLAYGLGQAVTDCFQTDTDALSSGYRPLVRGIVSRPHVLGVALGLLGASAAVIGALDRRALVPATLAVLGLLAYTPLKRRWWAGPPWNSAIVALLLPMGWLAAGGAAAEGLAGGYRLAPAMLALFFAYGDFVVTGYCKDISADRVTGYRTFPVAFGWRRTAFCGDAHAGLASAFTGVVLLGAPSPVPLAWIAFACATGISAAAHLRLHRGADERLAHGPIAHVLRAFVMYAAAITISRQPSWAPLLACCYLGFELALRSRPERSQI